MGFTPPRKVYVLDFADTELDGLEVRAKSAPLGMMLQLGASADSFNGVPDVGEMAELDEARQLALVKGSMTQLRAIVDMYAGVLVGWNLTDDDGQPVPATADGLLTLDPPHLMMIIRAWQQAVAAVPPASAPTSNAGAPSEVPPLPMAALSTSLAS
jgi:hypothetical protein